MWIFEAPKTYVEMCKKISQAVFYVTFMEIFILSQVSEDFASLMKTISFNTETEVIGIKLYVAYIYIPIIVSVLENIFKLHDHIGKIFNLRSKYSGRYMLKAYIDELQIKTSMSFDDIYNIYQKNNGLRKKVGNHFYHYVSDTNIKIDAHYVHMAVDSWCWVWILIDTVAVTFVFLLLILTLKIWGWNISYWLFLGLMVYIAFLLIICHVQLVINCKEYTLREIHLAVKKDKEENKNLKNKELKEAIEKCIMK